MIVDEINSEKAEALAEGKAGDLFFAMLNGKTAQETIATSRGDFTVKFPKQKDLVTIARVAAFMRSGIPASSFDAAGEYEINKIAMLDVMVDSGPAWFNKAKESPNFSWRDVPDASFADEVYAKALAFRQSVQGQLKGAQEAADGKTDREIPAGVPGDVGNGLFSGVASPAGGD